jgi:signal transduction histidine kinase
MEQRGTLLRGESALPLKATYVLVAGAVIVALSLERLIAQFASPAFSLSAFSLTIAIVAWASGFGPGLAAVVLSALAADYFVIEPGSFLRFSTSIDAAVFAIYIVGWLGFCALAGRVYKRTRQDRERREAAEHAARLSDRSAQLTLALAQARTPRAAMEAIVQEPLHALGADAGMLLVVSADGRFVEPARVVGHSQEEQDIAKQIALTDKSPISDAVGRAAPVILETPEARRTEYPRAPRALSARHSGASVDVPLLVGSRVVAVLHLDFNEPQTFGPGDRDFLLTLGARGAQALDRTWQVEHAQRARAEAETLRARADLELAERQSIEHALRVSEARYRTLGARTSRLHGLTAALSEAVTLGAVAQAIVHHGKIAVGAHAGDVTLLVENGTEFETLYAESGDMPLGDGRRFAVESGLCGTQAVQTRRPVFVGSFDEWQERFWRSASIAADGGYVSSATLPLLVEGTAIGVLAFHFTAPVNFDEDYQALLVSVAQHGAQALDRSRLYDSAQRARTDAEAANRLKDEFVSIVSHELRTPLNAILGWTSMLQRGSLDATTAGRALQSIHDNATRQAKLIDELLDFSRIIAGRTTLELEDVDLRDLLRGVVDSLVPAASAAGLELQLAPVPPIKVIGDVRRLEQVFFNLIGNALKFTPSGGRVSINALAQGPQAHVRVTDTGVGIDPAFLPHVFDRFRQADSATTRTYGGLGLGLSIAKQLVDAHKGSISVSSQGKGYGTTFTVALPVASSASSQTALARV